MPLVLATLILSLFLISPIERVDRDPQQRLVGRYLGTSSFVADNPADQGYSDTTGIWFIFEDSTYYYGEGDTLPEPDDAGDGGGAYEATDSTVSLNGAYPKILRPVIVLRGTFLCEFSGDTLVMIQPTGETVDGGHHLHLVRQ